MNRETLVIDDDRVICFVHKKLCESNGMPVSHSFTKPEEALAYLLQHNQDGKEFLLLLDINMPELNGWEFLQALEGHEIKAQMRVIMVTSSVDKADLEESKKYSLVRGFVTKPLNPSKISSIQEGKGFLELF